MPVSIYSETNNGYTNVVLEKTGEYSAEDFNKAIGQATVAYRKLRRSPKKSKWQKRLPYGLHGWESRTDGELREFCRDMGAEAPVVRDLEEYSPSVLLKGFGLEERKEVVNAIKEDVEKLGRASNITFGIALGSMAAALASNYFLGYYLSADYASLADYIEKNIAPIAVLTSVGLALGSALSLKYVEHKYSNIRQFLDSIRFVK